MAHPIAEDIVRDKLERAWKTKQSSLQFVILHCLNLSFTCRRPWILSMFKFEYQLQYDLIEKNPVKLDHEKCSTKFNWFIRTICYWFSINFDHVYSLHAAATQGSRYRLKNFKFWKINVCYKEILLVVLWCKNGTTTFKVNYLRSIGPEVISN